MIFLIVVLALIAILIVCFVSWFLTYKANGKCPICALKKLVIPTKLTIDISGEDDYTPDSSIVPPMGWSSWNTFRNRIDENLILETALAMKNSGLTDAGYEYINLDDCWQSSQRDADGKLQGDLRKFSRGIPELIKDINELGLKVGLYTSNGKLTCEDLPASIGNEVLDAKTFASWGCEFFKYDYCHHIVLSGNCPAVEQLEINKLESSDYICLTPEEAILTGRARVVKIPELESGKAVGFINHGAGTAQFNVQIEEEGEYALTVVYRKSASRKKQYMQLIINGKLYEMFFPESNGYSPSGRQQLVVKLNEGENTILLQNPIITPADSAYIQYKRMGDALKSATAQWAEFTNQEEKPITYSICEWGLSSPWSWGKKAGNMWRTTIDISSKWSRIMMIYDKTIKLYEHTGAGAFNDPDMLEVGNGKLTEEENKSHFSLWCMMSAPLILGNDIRKFVDGNNQPVEGNSVLKIVTNKHLIAIDRDSLCKSAKRIKKTAFFDIIAKPLSNGDTALCILNKSSSSKTASFDLNELCGDEYLSFKQAEEYELHELWSDERINATKINTAIAPHGVKVYRIKTL